MSRYEHSYTKDISALKAEKGLQVESYGAVGDGIVSDSIAFQNAINKAITNIFPAITLQQGKTYLLKASDVATYSGVSIIGNGAKIKLQGNVRFNIQNLNYFTCTDLNIETDVGLTEDSVSFSGYTMFYYTGAKNVLYNIQNVFAQSTVAQTPKISRYGTLFGLATATPGSSISNVITENFQTAVYVDGGSNFSIDHVYGTNAETLVYIHSGNTVGLFDIRLKNTQPQALTWLCKNNGIGAQGKDALLLEYGVSNVIMENIRGEFCIERVIYCQSSNVFANNLLAINCQGFKFCGPTFANAQQNVTVKNITLNVTDDLTATTTAYRILEMYYLTNVKVENVVLNNFRTDKKTNTIGTYCIMLYDGMHNVEIKNIDAEICTNQPLIFFTNLLDTTKTLSDIKISNINLINYGGFGNYYVFESGSGVVGWVNGVTIKNVNVKQDPSQPLNAALLNYVGELFTKEVTGLTLEDADIGYLAKGNPLSQTSSTFVSDNISKLNVTHNFLSRTSGSANEASYNATYATGAGTLYVPLCSCTQNYCAYYIRSSYADTITTTYENLSTTAVRMYDAIKTIKFDMLWNTGVQWNLAINTTGSSYLVEVESSLGCGKAIISGSTVTEIYKTGNCVFDSTASKLQVKPIAGSGSDYYIGINNVTGTLARVRVNVTKI